MPTATGTGTGTGTTTRATTTIATAPASQRRGPGVWKRWSDPNNPFESPDELEYGSDSSGESLITPTFTERVIQQNLAARKEHAQTRRARSRSSSSASDAPTAPAPPSRRVRSPSTDSTTEPKRVRRRLGSSHGRRPAQILSDSSEDESDDASSGPSRSAQPTARSIPSKRQARLRTTESEGSEDVVVKRVRTVGASRAVARSSDPESDRVVSSASESSNTNLARGRKRYTFRSSARREPPSEAGPSSSSSSEDDAVPPPRRGARYNLRSTAGKHSSPELDSSSSASPTPPARRMARTRRNGAARKPSTDSDSSSTEHTSPPPRRRGRAANKRRRDPSIDPASSRSGGDLLEEIELDEPERFQRRSRLRRRRSGGSFRDSLHALAQTRQALGRVSQVEYERTASEEGDSDADDEGSESGAEDGGSSSSSPKRNDSALAAGGDHDEDNGDFFVSDGDDDVPSALPVEFQSREHRFSIVFHILVTLAVLGTDAFHEVCEDDAAAACVLEMRSYYESMKNTVQVALWNTHFKDMLDTYPVFHSRRIVMGDRNPDWYCYACNRRNQAISQQAWLSGAPYDKETHEELNEDTTEDDGEGSDEDSEEVTPESWPTSLESRDSDHEQPSARWNDIRDALAKRTGANDKVQSSVSVHDDDGEGGARLSQPPSPSPSSDDSEQEHVKNLGHMGSLCKTRAQVYHALAHWEHAALLTIKATYADLVRVKGWEEEADSHVQRSASRGGTNAIAADMDDEESDDEDDEETQEDAEEKERAWTKLLRRSARNLTQADARSVVKIAEFMREVGVEKDIAKRLEKIELSVHKLRRV